LKLLVVCDVKGSHFVGLRRHFFAVDNNSARVRLLEEVYASQEGAFPGATRTDDANHIAFVGGERNTFQHFIVTEALVDVVNSQLASFALSRMEQHAVPLMININLRNGASTSRALV
jgi:hypothetical protein